MDTLIEAQQLLARAGIRAELSRAGHAQDILVVHAPPAELPAVQQASAELRSLGFRYVAIDITRGDE